MDFKIKPPLSETPISFPPPQDPVKREGLQTAIQALLAKGAISEVTDHSPGFYSRVFVVPKKSGGMRPVIDLSRLNKFLQVPHFKMETTRSLAKAVTLGDWTISLDLTDAYLHIPIHPEFRKYLRFVHNNKVYEFVCLPFGLATAPLVFTKVVTTLAAYLHKMNLLLHVYLDDWLLRNQCRQTLLRQRDFLLQIVQSCGFLVNLKKSDLTPSQDFLFIGIRFRTDLGLMLPPPDRIEKIISTVQFVQGLTAIPARAMLSLLGLLNSAADQIQLGRLYLRPLQLLLLSQWRPFQGDSRAMIKLPHDLLQEVWNFWGNEETLSVGVPLQESSPDVTLLTDASFQGWGAHIGLETTSGDWSPEQLNLDINVLEMLAVQKALQTFRDKVLNKTVLLLTDNTTVMFYLQKQGGTRSTLLCRLTWEILRWCALHQIKIQVKHIPGKKNVLADSLSRLSRLPGTEWTLLQGVVDRLGDLWGKPTLDLFATHQTKRLPCYVSPFPDPLAFAVDAMTIPWDGLLAYAYPPTALLLAVLQKLRQSESTELLLIAPAWPKQSWYPLLLQSIIDHPRRLPPLQHLLWHPSGKQYHQSPEVFHLHGWRVSSSVSARQDFLRRLPSVSPILSDSLLDHSTPVDGVSSNLGVVAGKQIRSLPLFQ